jgi:vesicle coat complex subunit
MRSLTFTCISLVLISGCGQQAVTSSGKPAEYWLQQARHADPKERQKAIKALGRLGPTEPAAMPALIAAVDDSNPAVRAEAVLALLNIGPAAREAIPALENAARDPDSRVKRLAAKALERIRGGGNG